MSKIEWIKQNPTHLGAEITWSLIDKDGTVIACVFNGRPFIWKTHAKFGTQIVVGNTGQADNLLKAMVDAAWDACSRGMLTEDEVTNLLAEAAHITKMPKITEDQKRKSRVRKLAIKKLKAINKELDLLMEAVDEPSVMNAYAEIVEAIFQLKTNPDYE